MLFLHFAGKFYQSTRRYQLDRYVFLHLQRFNANIDDLTSDLEVLIVICDQALRTGGRTPQHPSLYHLLHMWFNWHLYLYYFFNKSIQIILWISNTEHLNVFDEYAQKEESHVLPLPLMISIWTNVSKFFKFDNTHLFFLFLIFLVFFAFFAILLLKFERFLGDYGHAEEVLNYLHYRWYCQVSKAFNQTWKQINALIFDVSHFEYGLCSIMQEYVIVFHVFYFIALFDDHVAAYGHQQGDYTLAYYFLNIRPLH